MVNPEQFAELKQRVYVMRNGVTADSLRAAGCPYRLIFGLNLPQLTEIAAQYGPSAELASELRRHPDLRENILLAPMLYPSELLTYDEASAWAEECRWTEDADILCFKLLRKTSFAARLAHDLCGRPDRLRRYTGLRLWMNIVAAHPAEARADAEAELTRPDSLTALPRMIIQEADFLSE